MSELKRCPFCGGCASFGYAAGRYNLIEFIECDVCGAKSKAFSTEGGRGSYGEIKAIEAWNRRVTDE